MQGQQFPSKDTMWTCTCYIWSIPFAGTHSCAHICLQERLVNVWGLGIL